LQENLEKVEALSKEGPPDSEDPRALPPETPKEADGRRTEPPESSAESPPLPPIDLALLIASPVDAGHMERFPELTLVTDEALLAQANEARRHLASPEGRTLSQLVALLKKFENGFSPTTQERIDHLILDAETSYDPMAEITRQAFEEYNLIRKELLVQIPLFDRVGVLPEIRKNQAPLSGPSVGRRVQYLLSVRRLPAELQKRWVSEVESKYPLIQEGKEEEYLERAARFYEQNRDEILKAPEFHPLENTRRPLDPLSPPPKLRERLRSEAPELDLFDDADLQWALKEAKEFAGNNIVSDFWSQEGSYLLLKIRTLFSLSFGRLPPGSPLVEVGQAYLRHYDRLTSLAVAGASLPHLAQTGTDQLINFYRQNRPALLELLIENKGGKPCFEPSPKSAERSFWEESWRDLSDLKPRTR
jgi:hypothetical protein